MPLDREDIELLIRAVAVWEGQEAERGKVAIIVAALRAKSEEDEIVVEAVKAYKDGEARRLQFTRRAALITAKLIEVRESL
jgi:hypothetical protein